MNANVNVLRAESSRLNNHAVLGGAIGNAQAAI